MNSNNFLNPSELSLNKQSQILLASAVLMFLILSIWSVLTTRPESDEGAFASPAFNLAYKGHFGTTIFETYETNLTRIEERTYWVMPLFLLNASLAFKIFGFGLFTMRLVSVFWGLVLILSWYLIILKLSGNKVLASFCSLMTAASYVILVNASIARGDTLCAASGFAALAVYLTLRERNLLLAVFLSQCLVVISGLTHFLGILSFFGLLYLTIYYDFRSIGWRHIFIAALPYIVAGTAFGFWISRDFEAFGNQFLDNANASGRTDGLTSPLSSIIREFTFRYPRAFGLLEHSSGHSGPIYLKSLILVGYILGIAGVLFTAELRKKFHVLLVISFIYFILIAFLDGQKLAVYLPYTTTFYVVFAGIWLYYLWAKHKIPRVLTAFAAIFFILLQTGGIALRCRQNTFGNYYLPAVEFLNQNLDETKSVMGGANLIFFINPKADFVADGRFGYSTGKRPDFIVYDSGIEDSWKDSKIFSPHLYEYLPRLLNEEYRMVYENRAVKVYQRR